MISFSATNQLTFDNTSAWIQIRAVENTWLKARITEVIVRLRI